jgi:hypothetical protein
MKSFSSRTSTSCDHRWRDPDQQRRDTTALYERLAEQRRKQLEEAIERGEVQARSNQLRARLEALRACGSRHRLLKQRAS